MNGLVTLRERENKIMKIQGESEDRKEGGVGLIPLPSSSEKTLIDLSVYRAEAPLAGGAYHYCMCCTAAGQRRLMPDSDIKGCFYLGSERPAPGGSQSLDYVGYEPFPGVFREDFPLCGQCFNDLLLVGTTGGMQVVDKTINHALPKPYADVSFKDFRCIPPYAQHLQEVRDRVVEWSRKVVTDPRTAGLCYLFSESGTHGTGNGCGKTMLTCASYRYIAKRTASVMGNKVNIHSVIFKCEFLSVERLITEFWRRKRSQNPADEFYETDKGPTNFDGYRDYLAKRPVLFMDDLGRHQATGMVLETYEQILGTRSELALPTCITSNFGPRRLRERIGTWAASRVTRYRDNQRTIVEVKAPDYCLSRVEVPQRG